MGWQLSATFFIISAVLMISVCDSKRSRHHRVAHTDYVAEDDKETALFPDDYDDEDESGSILTQENPCLIHYCGKGRECIVQGQVAKCQCVRKCSKHLKSVCGDDGKLYPNHCELHRTSCVTNKPIYVDHSFSCIDRLHGENKSKQRLSSNFNTTVEKRKDEPTTTVAEEKEEEEEEDKKRLDEDEEEVFDNEVDGGEAITHPMNLCTLQKYEIMKDNLLLKHQDNTATVARTGVEWRNGNDYLVTSMFRHFDLDTNGFLTPDELEQISEKEHLSALSDGCTLSDMLKFDDLDKDNRIAINELYSAFSKLYSKFCSLFDHYLISFSTYSKEISEKEHLSALSDGCTLSDMLKFDDLDKDNRIAINELYSAFIFTIGDLSNFHDHVESVSTLPPKTSIVCKGVEWLKNDETLKLEADKYDLIGNGSELRIHKINYADTGAYMCQAKNKGGLTRDISSLIVQQEPTPTAPNEERRFFSFHDWGVSVYEPTACRLYHQIQSTDIIPGTQEYVCGDKGVNCSWGQAINVANRYVYVSQPTKDRVLVISKIQMVVVDVIVTDKFPVALHYVPHLDQVWLLNWRSSLDEGVKTIQVIRDAAQKRKHHTVHPEPIDGHFDLVMNLFMPAIQDMSGAFNYGYVSHAGQQGLYKLDLANMRYVKTVDLSNYSCLPKSAQFSSLYGLVIIECESSGQLVLDGLTDAVVSHKFSLTGKPMLSPDSRTLLTLDNQSRHGVTLVVQHVSDGGLKFVFDVKTTLNISSIAFYPSQTTHGYDLYASSTDKEDILFLNLLTGKVEMMTGVGKAMQPSLAQWENPNRPIAASGIFGHYMVTPANEALFVINGETRTVNCEIGGLVHPRAIVWVTMQLQ
ncbi:follistatin-related protein 5-like [Diaphorina citri]|uniref:Follistatin-related protein 5-like n=2 Tax=Diaphorina citri TaxID=121845 RepID=A0A3Q0J707_DIACI|nr:follistatin-related protein 5-like [Diaphorina citri]